MNICPVCGFAMTYPPSDFHICPSCGTEFGYDDSGTTYEALRDRWRKTGPAWWSPVDPQPVGWNPIEQLQRVTILNAPIPRLSEPPMFALTSGNNNVPTAIISRKKHGRAMGMGANSTLNPYPAEA